MSVFSYEDGIRGINQALISMHADHEKDRRKAKEEHEMVMFGLNVVFFSVLIVGWCVLKLKGRDISPRAPG